MIKTALFLIALISASTAFKTAHSETIEPSIAEPVCLVSHTDVVTINEVQVADMDILGNMIYTTTVHKEKVPVCDKWGKLT